METAPIRLTKLQRYLEHIYEVQVNHSVDDFLITDPQLLCALEQEENIRDNDEKLLLLQEEDCLNLALYLNPEILDRLGQSDPHVSLHPGNLADFCTVLEGVSHFLYLTWNATFDREVTHLELEMQAEVDKYIMVATLMGHQRQGCVPARLHHWLFADPAFDEALSAAEQTLYRHANHYAGKYCQQLANRYLFRYESRHCSMINDLRRFYRLSLQDKIRRIELAARY